MQKQDLLIEVQQAAAVNLVTQEELSAAFLAGQTSAPGVPKNRLKLSNILYYLGGAIVFFGIIILCYQNWGSFSSGLRIFVTLGSMIACFLVGALLYRYENFLEISQAFFLISGMLAPLALEVTLNEMGMDLGSSSIQLMVFVILTLIFLGGFYFYRQTILLFFGIAFATGIFHFLIDMIIGSRLSSSDAQTVLEYRLLVLGLAYMFLGYYVFFTSQKVLTGVLYAFGTLFFLGSAMALGGWNPNQNAFWELIFPLLVFGIIFLSVYVKSKAFLVFGCLFLIGYILKITGEYFTSGLGWPLALILAGLAIMGVGFWAVKLNKKYFANSI
jgi:hypothetical protein